MPRASPAPADGHISSYSLEALLLIALNHAAEGDQRQNRADHEDQNADDRCHLVVALILRQAVQPRHQQVNFVRVRVRHQLVGRGVHVAAEQPDDVEVIDVCHQRVDQRRPCDEENVRHGDGLERLPRVRAVNLRRLNQLRRDVHQDAGRNQHLIGDADPDVDEDNHRARPRGVGKERDEVRRRNRADGVEPVGQTDVLADGVDDAEVREEVANQQQRHELRHRHRDHEAGAPELLALCVAVVDEHGHQDAADIAGDGGQHRPHKRPCQHAHESVAERAVCGQGGELAEVLQPDPCEQLCRGQVVAVIIREADENHDNQRDDGEQHHAQHRQRQQRAVELLVQRVAQVVAEAVDMLAALGSDFHFPRIAQIAHPQHNSRNQQNYAQDTEKQDKKGVVIVVELVLHRFRVEDTLLLHCAQRGQLAHVGEEEGGEDDDDGGFQQAEEEALQVLLARKAACTAEKRRQLDENVALDKGFEWTGEKLCDAFKEPSDARLLLGDGLTHSIRAPSLLFLVPEIKNAAPLNCEEKRSG